MKKARRFFDACLDVLDRKGRDYSGTEDAMSNIRFCEEAGICSSETFVLGRIGEKFKRLLTTRGKKLAVKDEKRLDTVIDIVNYFELLSEVWEDNEKILDNKNML